MWNDSWKTLTPTGKTCQSFEVLKTWLSTSLIFGHTYVLCVNYQILCSVIGTKCNMYLWIEKTDLEKKECCTVTQLRIFTSLRNLIAWNFWVLSVVFITIITNFRFIVYHECFCLRQYSFLIAARKFETFMIQFKLFTPFS